MRHAPRLSLMGWLVVIVFALITGTAVAFLSEVVFLSDVQLSNGAKLAAVAALLVLIVQAFRILFARGGSK